jgi:tetratricopeptide (TPR) repeat protein
MYEHGRNWSYDADPFNPPSLKKVFELASGTTEQRNDLAKVIGELHTFSSSRKDREKVGQRKYFGLEGEVMHPVPDMEQVIAAYVKAAVYRPKRAFEAYYGLFKFLDGKDPQFTRRKIYVDDAFRCLQLPYPSDEILFTMKSQYDYGLAEKIWPTLAHLGRMQDAMSLKAKAEARGKPSKLNANLSEAPTSAFYAEVLKKFRDDGLDLNYAQRKLMIDDATKTLEANWNWNLADELSIVLFYIGRYDEAIKWYTKIKREAEAKTNGVPFEQVKRMNLHIGYAICKRDHPKDCSFKCIKSY